MGDRLPARTRFGTLLLDRPLVAWPAVVGARFPLARRAWPEFRNRGERLLPGPDGTGFDCDWQWSSRLTIARAWPFLAARLLRVALADRPIGLAALEEADRRLSERPLVSFVIGHRGRARLPHLLMTLRSILAHDDSVPVEILVVEQDQEPFLRPLLPGAIRHVPLRPRWPEMAYSRSWAFNVGVREAAGEIVILHDNDTLVPVDYAGEAARIVTNGWDGGRLQRLVFYLDSDSTSRVLETEKIAGVGGFDGVVQNSQGATIVIRKSAYEAVGGHDEEFVGWGGEDNEFFDRCKALPFHVWGYLPFVHLAHPPQPGAVGKTGGKELLAQRMSIPREERIRECREREWGRP